MPSKSVMYFQEANPLHGNKDINISFYIYIRIDQHFISIAEVRLSTDYNQCTYINGRLQIRGRSEVLVTFYS
jgi:hypothetical protein